MTPGANSRSSFRRRKSGNAVARRASRRTGLVALAAHRVCASRGGFDSTRLNIPVRQPVPSMRVTARPSWTPDGLPSCAPDERERPNHRSWTSLGPLPIARVAGSSAGSACAAHATTERTRPRVSPNVSASLVSIATRNYVTVGEDVPWERHQIQPLGAYDGLDERSRVKSLPRRSSRFEGPPERPYRVAGPALSEGRVSKACLSERTRVEDRAGARDSGTRRRMQHLCRRTSAHCFMRFVSIGSCGWPSSRRVPTHDDPISAAQPAAPPQLASRVGGALRGARCRLSSSLAFPPLIRFTRHPLRIGRSLHRFFRRPGVSLWRMPAPLPFTKTGVRSQRSLARRTVTPRHRSNVANASRPVLLVGPERRNLVATA